MRLQWVGKEVANTVVENGRFQGYLCAIGAYAVNGNGVDLFLHIGVTGEPLNLLLNGRNLGVDTGCYVYQEDGERPDFAGTRNLCLLDCLSGVADDNGLVIQRQGAPVWGET